MSDAADSRFLVGLKGFEGQQWVDTFFPDDLPEDWRLSYYGNEFRCLAMPANEAVALDLGVWEEWLEEQDEVFQLVMLASSAPELESGLGPLEPVLSLFNDTDVAVRVLADSSKGLWSQERNVDPTALDAVMFADEDLDTRTLRTRLQAFGEYLDGRSGCLFFEGPDASRAAREAKLVAELLGY